MKLVRSWPRNTAMTLIELLVAVTVGATLVVLLASMIDSGSRWGSTIQTGLTSRHDGKIVLDYLQRDMAGITAAEAKRNTLTIIPEKVAGPNGAEVSSLWIMLLNRPAVISGQGGIKTISYRLVYTDPMTPNGSYPRLALFRTAQSPEPNSENRFLHAEDLHSDFWLKNWGEYTAENGGRDLLDDYLLENIIDFKAKLHYRYLDASGERKMGSVLLDNEVHWTSQGFEGSDIAADETPNLPLSITFTLKVLRAGSTVQIEAGRPLAEVIESESVTVSRTIPILVNDLF